MAPASKSIHHPAGFLVSHFWRSLPRHTKTEPGGGKKKNAHNPPWAKNGERGGGREKKKPTSLPPPLHFFSCPLLFSYFLGCWWGSWALFSWCRLWENKLLLEMDGHHNGDEG